MAVPFCVITEFDIWIMVLIWLAALFLAIALFRR